MVDNSNKVLQKENFIKNQQKIAGTKLKHAVVQELKCFGKTTTIRKEMRIHTHFFNYG